MTLKVSVAGETDAASIALLHTAVAEQLTREYGRGHWSSCVTEKSVMRSVKTSRVLVARQGKPIIATLTLATKKPWAIDLAYFTNVRQALYLHDMAVAPEMQRKGIGRQLITEATVIARAWPCESIRLDAYDAEAGAGPFYEKCGFRPAGRVVYRNTPLAYFELLL